MQEILKTLREFLTKNYTPGKPVLLAYSGGWDSKSLLYALLELKNEFSIDLHLAHVDHSWRLESSEEAFMLKQEAKELNLPFHKLTLPKMQVSNLGEKCRELRYLFFKELYKKYNFQALLVAHQKDDVSETVLKRLLEGADLFSIKAMEEVSFQREMMVWRPFLRFSKSELLKVLQNKKLSAIDDPTNCDSRYQRSRMRTNIIPSLAKSFGKEISDNLYLAAQRSSEINRYLSKNTERYFEMKKEGPFGLYLDFSSLDIDPLEKKFLIKRLALHLNLDLSRSVIERILSSLEDGFNLRVKGCKIITYKNILFFLTKEIQPFTKKEILKEGKQKIDNWDIEIERVNKKDESKLPTWKDLWDGKVVFYLPYGDYSLVPPRGDMSYIKKRLTKWFSENKVPLFLRFCFPVIFKEDNMVFEFLSGKKRIGDLACEHYKISLKLTC